MTARTLARKTVNLALQGGGAHGAFTWGALDRLLDEERIEVEGITATSAGAMNAAAFKSGWLCPETGKREGARAALDGFWGSISKMGRGVPNPLLEWVRAFNPTTSAISDVIEASPGYFIGDALTRLFSPYDLNPFNLNPLRDLLERELDFERVCRHCAPHLFICATKVRDGKITVFRKDSISSDALLASACLPTMFQAIEIEDPETGLIEAYWDGGFTGNPALFPLFYRTESRDVVVVHINPIVRDEVPRTARDILNRINEISFNSSLLRELRAVEFAQRLLDEGRVPEGAMKRVFVHSVMDDDTMTKLGAATKLQPDWTLLCNLKEAGRAAMDGFLRNHWNDIGERSSVDLRDMFN